MVQLPWAIVMLGRTTNSLGVVRTLGERGVPVALVDLGAKGPASSSRYVGRTLLCPDFRSNPDSLAEVLISFARGLPQKPVLIPTGDRDVLAVSRSSAELRSWMEFEISPPAVIEVLVNKSKFQQTLFSLGLPVPRSTQAETVQELERIARAWDFPFVLKPSDSYGFVERFHFKLFAVRDKEDLELALKVIRRIGPGFVIQELIPAQIHYEVFSLGLPDRPLVSLGYDRIRQFPPNFGAACFCQVVHRPEAEKLARKALRSLGITGFAAVELILDGRDNSYKIIEINPRTSLQNRLSAAAGIPFEYLLYAGLAGLAPISPEPPKEGLRWSDDFVDPAAAFLHLIRGEQTLSEIAGHYLAPKTHSLLSIKDPMPCLKALRLSCSRAVSALTAARKVR